MTHIAASAVGNMEEVEKQETLLVHASEMCEESGM